MRLTVRAYQLSAFARFRLDISYVLHDIDRLLEAATDADGWGVIALAVQAVGHLRQEDPARALRYVVRATQLSKLVGPTGEDIQLGGVAVPDLLWMLVADLGTPELLRQWLDAVEALSGPQLSNFWNSFIGEHGVWLVPNKLYLLEHEKPKTDQNWNAVVETLRQILDRTRRLAEPRLEATVTALMVDILGERNDLNAIRAIAEATLARWPNTDVVKLKVYGAWGRAYAHQGRRDLALPILDMALSAGGSGQDHERLRCLLAANLCVHRQELRYVERARRLAEASIGIPTLEAARALAEYAVSRFELDGGQAGAIAAFPEFSAAMRRLFATPARGRVWKDLVVLIGHAAGFLTSMAREARAPEHTMDGEPWVAPSRGFFSKGFSVERVDFYRAGSEAGLFSLMREYSIAASNVNDAAYWSKLAISESRRVGAIFVQAIASISSVAELLASGALEDAVEAGVFAGRALEVHHAMKPLTRENADGIGVDLEEELKKLGTDQRRHADSFSLISALVPAALWIARISTSDRGAAADASRRAAATCRQLAEENGVDPEMWRASAAFFDLASEEQGNATPFLGRVRTIQGTDEAASALKTLGLILATPSASLSEAMHCQLTCVNKLLRWFLPHDTVYRLLMLPYIETFWQKAVDERRFLFRSPDVTCPAILAAIAEPEARRARAVLLAAAHGFEISRNLRVAVAELSESPKE